MTSTQNRKQEHQMTKDFIRMYCKGMDIDAMQACHRMSDIWGCQIDWHVFANALEALQQSGEAEYSNSRMIDGHTRYIVK